MDQPSRSTSGSEVGPAVSGWLLGIGSEVGLMVVGSSVGGSIRESVPVLSEVRMGAVGDGE